MEHMELITALVAVIGALVALLGYREYGARKNGRANNHNPNFGTLELLCEEILIAERDSLKMMGEMAVTLEGIKTNVGFCATRRE